MKVEAALTAIAAQVGFSADNLIQYAHDYEQYHYRFSDYRVLFAVVRALQPTYCLELGTDLGAGTNCIGHALIGKLQPSITTVDIADNSMIGSQIEPSIRQITTLICADIDTWILSHDGRYDFIYDDASHSIHQVQEIYKNVERLLNLGGVIMSHDAAGNGVGAWVREGQEKAGYFLPVYQIDPLPYGFTIYRKGH